jgi:hypothetical protein
MNGIATDSSTSSGSNSSGPNPSRPNPDDFIFKDAISSNYSSSSNSSNSNSSTHSSTDNTSFVLTNSGSANSSGSSSGKLSNFSNVSNFMGIKKSMINNNKIIIDVAVLCQEYTNVETMCNDHIVNLDEIIISKELFKSIFYPYSENFGINKDFVCNNNEIFPYISFLPEFRSVNGKRFYLLEELISNIESDLNVSRNCFTKESLVELTNEIFDIKSLCNINCCSVLSSLTWTNINEIISNYRLVQNSCSDVIIILVVNIIFKTPTPGVKNTLLRLQYRIS